MAEVLSPGKPRGNGGATPSTLSRGTKLGRYELLAPIGVGGMAKVWAARQYGYGGFAKVVAIKTILPHLSREADFERLFVDEARVASLVRHPNVCEIFELGEEGDVLYLVMEWVDGDSLFKLLGGTGLGPTTGGLVARIDARVAARIAAETCAGIHAAHQQTDHDGRPLNIVHRDVSPHNILLSAEGVVKVTDFGVAKASGQTHDQTMAGQLKGKLEYMSPEQVTGVRVDGRTDVFGMGGVLYEATTGIQPFASPGDLEVMTKIVDGRLVPPSAHLTDYPPELETIVLRAMAHEPANRYESAEEMREALEGWLARSGPPVTHAHVAALLRSRVGPKIDERLSRVRDAMNAAPQKRSSHTPSTSGIIPTPPPRIAPPPAPLPRRPPPGRLEDEAPDSNSGGADTVVDIDTSDIEALQWPPSSQGARRRPSVPPPRPSVPPQSGPPPLPISSSQSGGFSAVRTSAPGASRASGASFGPAPTETGSRPADPLPVDTRQYIIAAVFGAVIAMVLGGALYFVWQWVDPDFARPAPHATGSP